jgi:hypothetical protein
VSPGALDRVATLPRCPGRWQARTVRAVLLGVAILAMAGCSGATAPTPTPDSPDAGECVEMTGPETDLALTVVDCSTAPYEVLEVIEEMTSDATCPPTTELEVERTLQLVQPGETPSPGGSGVRTQTLCLREQAPSAS